MPRRAPSLIPTLLTTALVALGASSCSSSPHSGEGSGALRVTLIDHSGGQRFELVNELHTPGVEYYSVARKDASRKVVETEILEALVDELDRLGMDDHLAAGGAPRADALPEGTVTRSLELERDGRRQQWSVGQRTDPAERKAFHECSAAMLQVYNFAQAYQAIDNPQGAAYFEQPQHGR